jgi:hypothetical protein
VWLDKDTKNTKSISFFQFCLFVYLYDNKVDESNQQLALPQQRCGLKFVQLYTSKSYENRRKDLINPPENDDDDSDYSLKPDNRMDEDASVKKHVLSPRLVNAIYQSAQVVWANSHSPTGLTGRSDLELQTAVGLPVAVDDSGNMCVVVMFSPNMIPSSDDAMEYLYSISQSATSSSIPCLLPVFNEQTTRGRQIFALPHSQHNLQHSNDELGEGVVARFVSLDEGHVVEDDNEQGTHDLALAPKDTFGIPMLPCFAELRTQAVSDDNIDIFDEASYGVWHTIMDSEQLFQDEMLKGVADGSVDSGFDLQRDLQAGNENPLIEGTNATASTKKINVAAGSVSVQSFTETPLLSESRRLRLEEFCQAFLGMSVFDIADIWVPADSSEYPDCLQHVASVLASNETNNVLHQFNERSYNVLIKYWTGAVGRAYSSGNPVWSANRTVFVDPGRSVDFARAKIQTVFAIPIFTGKETMPSCIVAFYSLMRSGSVPFVLRFVQQALRLLWDGLEKVKPHQSINDGVWHQIEPADLGEMAADLEMQQSFLSKKRRHDSFSIAEFFKNQESFDDASTNNLASNLEQISLPEAEVVSMPLQMNENYTRTLEFNGNFVESTGSEQTSNLNNDLPAYSVHLASATNAEGTKRAHVLFSRSSEMEGVNYVVNQSPLPVPAPLAMPSRLPNHVIAPNQHQKLPNMHVSPLSAKLSIQQHLSTVWQPSKSTYQSSSSMTGDLSVPQQTPATSERIVYKHQSASSQHHGMQQASSSGHRSAMQQQSMSGGQVPIFQQQTPTNGQLPLFQQDTPTNGQLPVFQQNTPTTSNGQLLGFQQNSPTNGQLPVFQQSTPTNGQLPVFQQNTPTNGQLPVFQNNTPTNGQLPVFQRNTAANGQLPVPSEYPD